MNDYNQIAEKCCGSCEHYTLDDYKQGFCSLIHYQILTTDIPTLKCESVDNYTARNPIDNPYKLMWEGFMHKIVLMHDEGIISIHLFEQLAEITEQLEKEKE